MARHLRYKLIYIIYDNIIIYKIWIIKIEYTHVVVLNTISIAKMTKEMLFPQMFIELVFV